MQSNRFARRARLACTWILAAAVGGACALEGGDDAAQTEAPLSVVAPPAPVAAFSAGGHLVDMEPCGADPNCATDVPMTGNPSPLFAEVDEAMRVFMKTQCVGSGVLAISYNGRRVYKRGFGRMNGSALEDLPAHCSGDSFANGDFMLPDENINIGSASKYVTGSMVRALVKQRILERGLSATYPDPTMARLLDPDLDLLPTKLLRYFDSSRDDAECPPVRTSDITGCTRGTCNNGPDLRWQNVTIGDLLGHTAGLPKSAPSFETTMKNVAALRGHDSAGDFAGENDSVRDNTPYQSQLDDAREYLAGEIGADAEDVYFVDYFDRGADAPVDEILTMVAGRCLAGSPAGQSDTAPLPMGTYSNTGFAMLERVVAHLHPSGRFAAIEGDPASHVGSALGDFLLAEGLEAGVQNEHAIYARHKTIENPGGAERRSWNDAQSTYLPVTTSFMRPFCVWADGSCDFDYWWNGSSANDKYRLPANFDFGGIMFDDDGYAVPTSDPPKVPIELKSYVPNPGTGNLAIEAPAYLALMDKYYIGASNDSRLGRPRSGCGNSCNVTGMKDGDAGGTYARAMTLVGGNKSATLPPRAPDGSLTIEPDFDQWSTANWTDASGVDFIVSINQERDEQGGSDGYAAASLIRYALSRVDWAAVDRMVTLQRMQIVGMGINQYGDTYYWYENDKKQVLDGLPVDHAIQPAPRAAGPWLPLPKAGAEGAVPADHYELPSTRIGSDVVAIDMNDDDRVYAWYDDGHRSAGHSGDLADEIAPAPYTVPDGYTYNDIVEIAISSGDTVATWFKDGKMGFGTSTALASGGLNDYTLPPGQTIDQIVGMAIDRTNDHVYTVFKDGGAAEGNYEHLDVFGYRPGAVAGMGMRNGDTSIWYLSGYRKDLDGSPAANLEDADVLPSSSHYLLPPGKAYSDIVAAAYPPYFTPVMWFSDNTRAIGSGAGDFPTATAANTTWPVGASAATVLGIGFVDDGSTYSWYNTNHRAKGSLTNLGSGATYNSFTLPDDQYEFDIVGMAIDVQGSGDVLTLFRDGAVARGRSWDLADENYWPTPHAILLP
jgi:hypothetical protein